MGHCRLKIIFFIFFITTCCHYSNACGIVGTFPGVYYYGWIRDVDEGIIWRNETTVANAITNYTLDEEFTRWYLGVQVIDSKFELFTTEYFKDYEEYEVSQIITVGVTYDCTVNNNMLPQLIRLHVKDTNNNPPTFLPSNEYVINIAAPMPPGYEITGCGYGIIVRDIDLTTQKIIFEIEDNPYFEIEKEIHRNSSTPKEFKAIIRTKSFIRSFPEELKLTIWATDNDRTEDEPRTKEATITFLGNDFVLPEEPVFSETFYLADYTDDNQVVLTKPITLKSGYDKHVQFNIKGDYSNFKLVEDEENKISIHVVKALAEEVLTETNIHLIVTADRELTSGASATVVLRLPEVVPLDFQRSHYKGKIEDNNLDAPPLILSQGYEDTAVNATVLNAYSSYFSANVEGDTITLSMTTLQESIILDNNFLNLVVLATNGRSTARTIVTLEIVKDDNVTPVFNKPIYIGSYSPTGLILEKIELVQGYEEVNSVDLHGDDKKYFRAVLNGATVTIEAETIPPAIYSQERVVLTLEVMKPRTVGASATIIINLPAPRVMEFEASTHRGSIKNNALTLDPIRLAVGYDNSVVFTITGDYAKYFQVTNGQNPAIITPEPDIPSDVILNNNVIFLTVVASGLNAVTTTTSVILDIIKDDTTTPVFSSNIYYGTYLDILNFDIQNIHLTQGSDGDISFKLDGDHAQYFDYSIKGNDVVVYPRSVIPQDVIFEKKVLVFNILAMKALTVGASAAISIRFPADLTDQVILSFAQSTYTGTLASNDLTIDGSIKLSAGYAPGTDFILTGEFSEHFNALPNEEVLTLTLLDTLPVEARERAFIVLEIEAKRDRAVSAWTSVVIEVVRQEIVPPVFDQTYYRGAYNAESGLRFTQVISLSQGFDDTVHFTLDGELISLFVLSSRDSNSLLISAANPIPSDVLQAHSQILFAVVATKPGALTARSAVSIDIEKDLQVGDDVSFDRVLYRGVLQLDEVRHDVIRVYGYVGIVDIIGVYSNMFETSVSGGRVTVRALGSLSLPADVTYLTLELNAASARAVLLLNVVESGGTLEPTVTFSSETYRLSVDITQTGFVGRVSASANTGEDLTYSLGTDDAHLQTRLSINNEGELHLSAPANSGVYAFQVIATTVSSEATGTAWVHLTAQAVTVCDDKGIVMPPLIILERDEEAPHSNLVVLDSTQHAGCHFTLTNRWPTDQTWLYVNEFGLHTNAIDREHASIAFMALSQVQVELTLHCRSDNDNAIRKKRSKTTERLGPYDYGSNKWILTDTIPYNSRRSLVNLIVKDINDNDPIFVGIEHQPIAVGYPSAELEERILPRSLAELQATDADIGENAALRYWSDETVLAVAPTTGFVHVRTGARLTHDQILDVSATDENGQGRTGTIQLIVKLLDLNHIAVVTIRDAFLSDEPTVLAQLSNAIGYEVKVLRSVVISDDIDVDVTRNKREVGTRGASLQLYVYGIDQREAVTVDRLTANISANAAIANVVSTISLEDHLEDLNILDHQIGLLVATIILGVLLFVVILLVAIWFFLRWRKANNHKEFHDESSISNNSSLGELPKPETEQPRLNIEDLRRSERRLQEMLQAPIEQVTVEPMPKKTETPVEAILDLPINEPSAPIVIQSIDKLKDAEESSDDEFGEVSPNRRKSVVTFNENVEKIIHVEDNADDDGDGDDASINPSIDASNSGFEIYRL